MKLDRELTREIKKEANGDGSREARVKFAKRLRETSRALSTPEIMRGALEKAIKEHGRVPVAICLAVTIWMRYDRLRPGTVQWAREVLTVWTNKPINYLIANISDGLHPTRIEEYAGEFIRLTTEEE